MVPVNPFNSFLFEEPHFSLFVHSIIIPICHPLMMEVIQLVFGKRTGSPPAYTGAIYRLMTASM